MCRREENSMVKRQPLHFYNEPLPGVDRLELPALGTDARVAHV